jgi:hypothetical protein
MTHVWLLRALVVWGCLWFVAHRAVNNVNARPWRQQGAFTHNVEIVCMLGFLLTLIGVVFAWPVI